MGDNLPIFNEYTLKKGLNTLSFSPVFSAGKSTGSSLLISTGYSFTRFCRNSSGLLAQKTLMNCFANAMNECVSFLRALNAGLTLYDEDYPLTDVATMVGDTF